MIFDICLAAAYISTACPNEFLGFLMAGLKVPRERILPRRHRESNVAQASLAQY